MNGQCFNFLMRGVGAAGLCWARCGDISSLGMPVLSELFKRRRSPGHYRCYKRKHSAAAFEALRRWGRPQLRTA